ncbi:6-phosphofructo-2-kinase [Malassezia pachydermatis]|uniref:6-phosphofructo-2-kinase n=1 Tax=Malassezia pachydermatis TaxID=77020 RepID=A0A0M8MYR8_9BASI|nr:6-phosphofructo-2-kinase [Malassezia pachydermatis]KOS16420.1 6-phosphofructo-2-kinase [Malassezia pachydermatis]
MAPPLYTTQSGRLWHAGQILIMTVGLPGRGKTHLAHAIQRYLRWLGVRCQVFNLANMRRDLLGSVKDLPADYFGDGCRAEEETLALREQVTTKITEKIAAFFEDGGQVAVYDANNSTKERRSLIRERFEKELNVQIMFVECLCDDPKIVERNIRSMHRFNPDYRGWKLEDVKKHFSDRISRHEMDYQPIDTTTAAHIQLHNFGQRVVVNNVKGYLQNRIVFFLMNMHNEDRTIYFARAGEALIEHLYKADAELSSLGHEYAQRLCEFMMMRRSHDNAVDEDKPTLSQEHTVSYISSHDENDVPFEFEETEREFQVWCSTRKRSENTAAPFRDYDVRIIEWSRLAEMNPGVVDGMSEEEILSRFPKYHEEQKKDPYTFRFPRAESYHDLAIRLEPVILELERVRKDVLIIAQSSVLRCLIAYLQGNKPTEIPFIQVREGDLVEVHPQAFGVATRVYSFWNPEKEREKRDIEFATRAAMAIAQQRAEKERQSKVGQEEEDLESSTVTEMAAQMEKTISL